MFFLAFDSAHLSPDKPAEAGDPGRGQALVPIGLLHLKLWHLGHPPKEVGSEH